MCASVLGGQVIHFNPLPLCRGRPDTLVENLPQLIISILSLYTEGDYIILYPSFGIYISILSLYAEGDSRAKSPERNLDISILSLYAEGDHYTSQPDKECHLFQSSPSMQRETMPKILLHFWLYEFQSSPSMQRETF